MPGRAAVTGVVLTVLVMFLVFTLEFFLPLSVKSDMNLCCRGALLKMEIEGGLSAETETELKAELTAMGFRNIYVKGTERAMHGEKINLRVEADYMYSKLTGLFSRSEIVQRMVYDRTTIARKVVN